MLKEALDARWISVDALPDLDWLPADRALIGKILGIAGEGRIL